VFEHLSCHNHVKRRLAERRSEPVRADVPQLDIEAKLARTGLGAVQARYVDTDEREPVVKGNEWLPEIERFGSGAADVEYAKMPHPGRQRREIERQTKLRRIAGKRIRRESTLSELLQH